MNRTYHTARPVIAGFALAMLLAAPAHADPAHGSTQVGALGKATAASRTVEVKLGDNFFEPGSIKVRAGETVRFVLRNGGEFLHEFNIGTVPMHAAHQREMAAMMERGMLTPTGMNGHSMNANGSAKNGAASKPATMKHDDPNSVLVEPGKTKELVWKFGKAMTLEFACNIPGHYESGMVGKVVFRK